MPLLRRLRYRIWAVSRAEGSPETVREELEAAREVFVRLTYSWSVMLEDISIW